MSKVITFSRVFPAYHPKKGQPTHFVEKLWKSLGNLNYQWDLVKVLQVSDALNVKMPYSEFEPKHHTIRAGNRWKVGDKFSPRVWSGKPYNSKQIIIAPDITIVSVQKIEMDLNGIFSVDGKYLDEIHFLELAKNDGLEFNDMINWFMPNYDKPKEFKGQIICWNENIEY